MDSHELEYLDLHHELLPYEEALRHLQLIERNDDLKRYFKGANRAGRWFFQILNQEFVQSLADKINEIVMANRNPGPILEVMSGDGRLTEFLAKRVHRSIIATDARDGRYNIAYPKWVRRMDAIEAVESCSPSFILISWEPHLSEMGIKIVEFGIPTAWIGQYGKCGHPALFDIQHTKTNNNYALGKFDSFLRKELHTDIYLFNC
ncbi:MAG: class I SAM-dependent methyltransferase [Candidatus Thorarchaeota archaeon]|jgi:hypothetical protein